MELSAGSTRLVLDEALGARVSSLLVPRPDADVDAAGGGDGGDLPGLLQLSGRYADSPHGWGAFPMAPWAGRVRNGVLSWQGVDHQLPVTKPPHAIHGLVAREPWDVVESGTSSAVLRRDVGPAWPWAAHTVLRYDLSPSELVTVLEVHADTDPMPAWCGIHPWFPRHVAGSSVRIDLSAGGMLLRDDTGLPTGTVVAVAAGAPMQPPVDDTFADVAWPVTLTWPGVAQLEVSADTPWAVVFTEREEAVCVEPQTAPPDAANLGLAPTVEPGTPLVLTMRWRWRVLG